jgi:hypothetical protein
MIFETRRRKNFGHFVDNRGDFCVTHTTKKIAHYRNGTPLLICWGNGEPDTKAARAWLAEHKNMEEMHYAHEEGTSELLRVIAVSIR